MHCPKCGDEYDEGYTECADCHVSLVPGPPPPPPKPHYVELQPVLATHNLGDIAIIKAVLQSEGITHFFEGECFNLIHPFVQPARLLIQKDQVERAKEALRTLKLSYFAI